MNNIQVFTSLDGRYTTIKIENEEYVKNRKKELETQELLKIIYRWLEK